jgi:outer membrane protein assembly factor BamB
MKMKKNYIYLSMLTLFLLVLASNTVYALHPTADPWIMYRHDNARSGTTTSTAPNTNKTAWSVSANYATMPLLVYEGKVYYMSSSNVYALDETTGVQLWRSISLNSIQAPMTIADGRIYVGSSAGYLYCLDATTGTKLWETQLTSTGNIVTSSVVANGRVYVTTTDDAPAYNLFALNASTGGYIGTPPNIWRYRASKGIWSSPAIEGDMVYFGSEDGKLYAINTSLSVPLLKWTFPTNGRIRCTPTIYADKVIFGSYYTDRSVFAVFKANGTMIWKFQTIAGYSIENSLAVSEGIAYFVPSGSNKAYAIYTDATPGNYTENDPLIKKWSQTLSTYGYVEPVVADRKVFLTMGSKLYALATSDGSQLWTYTSAQSLYGSVVADGRIFVSEYYAMTCIGSMFPPVTYYYTVHAGGLDHEVVLVINATAEPLDVSGLTPTLRTIAYNLTGIAGTKGMSNITIPKSLMSGFETTSVLVDGGLPTTGPIISTNATHTSLYFTYAHSYHTVTITSNSILPEFPTAFILPLLIMMSLVTVGLAKRKLRAP